MPSEILQESFEIIAQFYGDNPPEIKSIVRGQKFLGVQLTDMNIGISLIEHDWSHEFPLFLERTQKDLPEAYALARRAFEGEGMEICYGIATMNALTSGIFKNSEKYDLIEDKDITEIWKDYLKPDDVIGMVGYMYPLVDALLPSCSKILILDMHARDEGKNPLPKEVSLIDSADGLDVVDVLIATGSSLIYHSTEELIEKSKNARLKAVVGPSVTLPSEPFWNRGVQYIGGAIVNENFLQAIIVEDTREDWKTYTKRMKKKTLALKFGKNSGIRKIGLLKM